MRKIFSPLLILFGIMFASCSTNTENLTVEPDNGGENNPPIIEQVSYASNVQPIFNASCTNCHGGSGGVNLTSFSALMGSVGNNYGDNVIVAGNADASGLVDKIEPNPQHGSRMPTNGSLTNTEIQTIRTWINEGALNN